MVCEYARELPPHSVRQSSGLLDRDDFFNGTGTRWIIRDNMYIAWGQQRLSSIGSISSWVHYFIICIQSSWLFEGFSLVFEKLFFIVQRRFFSFQYILLSINCAVKRRCVLFKTQMRIFIKLFCILRQKKLNQEYDICNLLKKIKAALIFKANKWVR